MPASLCERIQIGSLLYVSPSSNVYFPENKFSRPTTSLLLTNQRAGGASSAVVSGIGGSGAFPGTLPEGALLCLFCFRPIRACDAVCNLLRRFAVPAREHYPVA
eukprot:1182254-Prorocentrum_minimum.AAC.2